MALYGETMLIVMSIVGLHVGGSAWTSVLALAMMPGAFALFAGGMAIRPAKTLVQGLQQDLAERSVEVYGEEEIVRLPVSGLALVLYGNATNVGVTLPVASGAPKSGGDTYPARFEWRPERGRFALCRRLSSTELAELELLRHRIATRHIVPTIGFFAFSSLAIITLIQTNQTSDRLVPVAVLCAGLWFVWQLGHDLFVSHRLGREHAVVTDKVRDGGRERAVEVLPSASLVWTIDRAPAGWRF